MPREDQADAVLRALAEAGRPLSTAALETAVDVRRTRLELLLKVLDVDGAVQRVSGGWVATGAPWEYDAERYERVAAARRDEQQLMVDYERTDACRMAFLQECLDDDTAAPCGRCDGCAGPWYPTDVPDRVRRRRPRAAGPGSASTSTPGPSGPPGWTGSGSRSRAGSPPRRRCCAGGPSPGCPTSAGGSGCARCSARTPRPPPSSCGPACPCSPSGAGPSGRSASSRCPRAARPQLVGSLAAGLAEIGRLRFLGTLDLAHDGPTGEMGGNSAYRLAGVWERLVVGPELAAALADCPGPVLLVDDVVSSRWTLTVAGRALRLAGAPGVLPFALAVDG